MSLIRINRNPSRKDLRVFSLTWLVFFSIISLVTSLREVDHVSGYLLIIASTGVLGLAWPRRMRPLYLGAIYVTFPIGFILSHLILGVVYYLVITPIGLTMRLCGKDPLQRKLEPNRKSYWIRRPPNPKPASYLNQY